MIENPLVFANGFLGFNSEIVNALVIAATSKTFLEKLYEYSHSFEKRIIENPLDLPMDFYFGIGNSECSNES